MSLFRLILIILLFYVIYYVLKLFIVNFRIGSRNADSINRGKKPKSKYKDVEEADFTEIKKRDENKTEN